MRPHRWYWLAPVIALLATACGSGVAGPPPGVITNPPKAVFTSPPVGVVTTPPIKAQACTGQMVTPASHVQAVIDAAAPGTTFCFRPGTYHVSSLRPKSGDVLDGDGQRAILDGAHSAAFAIYGDSASRGPSDVTVEGFVIRDYSTPLQRGAIQDYNGPGWIIKYNHITDNAAAGVATGSNVQVLNNLIDHNGQEGFSAQGNGGLYKDNNIGYNNFNVAVNYNWEAGGGKAWSTDHLTFESNYVHNNGGPGLWADTNNINTVFDHNTVSNNRGPGIYDEISYNVTITNNIVTGNGMPSAPGKAVNQGWGWYAGIQLRASGGLSPSSPAVISGNVVVNNFNGITLLQSPSPDACSNKANDEGYYGPCLIRNVIVENNYITMSQGTTGELTDGTNNSIFTSWNNHWQNNHYCVASATDPGDGYSGGWFAFQNGYSSWSEWQHDGLDPGGSFEVGGTCWPADVTPSFSS